MHCFMSIVFVLMMKLISMELTLRRITQAKCIVENRNKLPEALWQGNVLVVQMYFIALAQGDILVTDSHIVMFDFTKYGKYFCVTYKIQMLSIIIINIIKYN